jgi:hypothetical protein
VAGPRSSASGRLGDLGHDQVIVFELGLPLRLTVASADAKPDPAAADHI